MFLYVSVFIAILLTEINLVYTRFKKSNLFGIFEALLQNRNTSIDYEINPK